MNRVSRGELCEEEGPLGLPRFSVSLLYPLSLFWVLWLPPSAEAATLRYALIIGNNAGTDGAVSSLPGLRHAEREAIALRENLVRYSHFDPSPERTVLLTGASRAEVNRAVANLVARKQADKRELGSVDVMFAFFFTGHGASGKLFLKDGPLSGQDVANVFKAFAPDIGLGFFDACFSGSLELLRSKGFEPTAGASIFQKMPEEVLKARGSMWFASSDAQELSFEDDRIGGVFTHFFTEALAKADPDGPGITIERIFRYASENTIQYTAKRGRQQTPQWFVANLRTTGPLYFSFPGQRDATLMFSEGVEGQFLVTYANGHLTELVDKKRGQVQVLPMYPGEAWLSLVDQGKVVFHRSIALEARRRIIIQSQHDGSLEHRLGEQEQTLWVKGHREQTFTATSVERAPLMSEWGVQYQLWSPRPSALTPQHLVLPGLRLKWTEVSLDLLAGYGFKRDFFPSWGYTAHAAVAELWGGYSSNLAGLNVRFSAGISGGLCWERFHNGPRRQEPLGQSGAALHLQIPGINKVAGELGLMGGWAWASGSGLNGRPVWHPWLGASLGLWIR